MHAFADPRINAPSRVSDLYGDDRQRALIARHRAHRDAYMAPYEQPAPHGSEYTGPYRIPAIIGTVVVGVPVIAMLVGGLLS